MNRRDLISMAIQNLWRRKLRTFLTVLGVLIGTSSIVVMLSLGFGMSKSMEDQISSWGSLTQITVYPGGGMGMIGLDSGSSNRRNKEAHLNKNSIQEFKKIPNVAGVNATKQMSGKFVIGRNEANSQLVGIEPENMEIFDFKLSEGRLLQDSDKMSVVFGGQVAENFYNPKSQSYQPANVDLMRDRIKLVVEDYNSNSEKPRSKEYKINTVGVLSAEDFETSYSVYIPMEQLDKINKDLKKDQKQNPRDRQNKNEYDSVQIKVEDRDHVKAVQDTVKEMGFEAFSLTDQLDSVKETTAIMQAVLGGIGAISLLVAAIGITNTMIMSIYERTKEIGIMKVIGASIKDIKRLFLVESGFIGLLGGLFGLAFSYMISYLMNNFAAGFISGMGFGEGSKISIIPPLLAIGALAFSLVIGLIAGYFPAKRAMNLSALEAIRTE